MSETGHPINLAHFSDLITAVQTFGTRYVPSNPLLKLSALKTLRDTVQSDMQALKDATAARSAAENTRNALFDPLDTLTRRILASSKSAGATPDQLGDMDETARKIKGDRAGTKNPGPLNPGDPHSISVSQQSFINLADHLGGLITTLKNIPAYNPAEADLKIAALQTLQTSMVAANAGANAADITYTTAKTARNKGMYADGTGFVDTAALVKEYVFSSSNLGAKNPDYKVVKGISFTRLKK